MSPAHVATKIPRIRAPNANITSCDWIHPVAGKHPMLQRQPFGHLSSRRLSRGGCLSCRLLEGACGTAVFQPHWPPRPWRIFASKTAKCNSSRIHFRQTCGSLNIGFWRRRAFDSADFFAEGPRSYSYFSGSESNG